MSTEPRRINLALVPEVFAHPPHVPEPAQAERLSALHDAAATFATAILSNTPGCADQTAAVRHVREALWSARSAVTLDGLV
jgi:hypothetical protein